VAEPPELDKSEALFAVIRSSMRAAFHRRNLHSSRTIVDCHLPPGGVP
jgi:hypothetical protein